MYYENKNSSLGWSIALVILVAVLVIGAIVALLPETDGGIKDQINDTIDKVVNGGSETKDPNGTTKEPDETTKDPSEGDVVGGNASCAHEWDDGEVTKAATCSTAGVKTFTCIKDGCGAKSTGDIPATGVHVYKTYSKKSDTEHISMCAECQVETFREGHNFVYTKINATCDSDGQHIYECSDCKYKKTIPIEATGHKVVSYSPSAYSELLHVGTCTVCSEQVSELHNGSEVVSKEATCTENGEKKKTCSVCSKVNTSVIPATGHKYVDDHVSKEATCTTAGTLVQKCNNCQGTKVVSIPVQLHVYGSWEIVTAATCTTSGQKKRVCKNCDDEQTSVIAMSGHDYEYQVITAPTCTTDGLMGTKCNNCGAISGHTEREIALGHDYQIAGDRWQCTRCGDVDEDRSVFD